MKSRALLLVVWFAWIACATQAQAPVHAPDGGTRYRVEGVDLLPLAGMPLTGKSSIQWARTLEDGSTVNMRLEANLARDSAGRMYRERRSFVPVNSAQQSRLEDILLFDLVAKTKTICILSTKKCLVADYYPHRQFALQPPGPFANGTRSLTREDLGQDQINGMSVAGTRETTIINPEVVGNEKALISTREFWYSASIRTNLLVTRVDPREGKQTIQLIDLSLGEPDPGMFEVPKGFTVTDERTGVRAQR